MTVSDFNSIGYLRTFECEELLEILSKSKEPIAKKICYKLKENIRMKKFQWEKYPEEHEIRPTFYVDGEKNDNEIC